MRTSSLYFLCLVVLAGCGAGAGSMTARTSFERSDARFADHDQDRDDHLSDEEFLRAAGLYHGALDRDGDGRLTDRELAGGLYRLWDTNRSGQLESAELEHGIIAWFPSEIAPRLEEWDGDGDGRVDQDEFDRGLERVRAFHQYDDDGDGEVTDRELGAALFDSWDMDGNAAIDALEWRWD